MQQINCMSDRRTGESQRGQWISQKLGWGHNPGADAGDWREGGETGPGLSLPPSFVDDGTQPWAQLAGGSTQHPVPTRGGTEHWSCLTYWQGFFWFICGFSLQPEYGSTKAGPWLCCTLLYPWILKQCMASSRHSVNACWMKEYASTNCASDLQQALSKYILNKWGWFTIIQLGNCYMKYNKVPFSFTSVQHIL